MSYASPKLQTAELSIVVPCYNEQQTVVKLLDCLREILPDAEIIVVDDASTDCSLELIREVQSTLDLKVISLKENGGKGTAVRTGLQSASRGWVVIQDADLEYDPQDLREMLTAAQQGSLPAVYGSRYLGRGRATGGAVLNFWGVKILALLSYLLFGKWLTDPHTCYKMVQRDLMDTLNLRSTGFELCAEINSKLLRHGTPIVEIPISYQPRDHAAGKKIVLADFFRSALTYLECRFSIDNRTPK
ncbi:glycosyltransferase family 2 protein [Roseimaritima sediminicola]|uniref:glycosyltransferase family 2 protein n=1 Tax=Roseimaritima sediminicola TaxID=2662066 RepID=UPI0012984AB7|nr:glycosyltransferase family 2 protein [Roseimaritima sediminicola]